ncbi:MAG: DNA mismatch repair endonuclease MutL [Bacteroidales bacterium]|jgi:DNA mismatch repair protein MutL|nr:DNA mismatch repair endonuclease MutL [Bacteroidales bacterium]
MNDIIHLLTDAVANQIAAGEVVQRPASVVKELLENSVDAGATDIQLIIKDSGKTLIQVTDNGKGMSFNDARLCFERHATSKITCADDLFKLVTKGFRGEALASIAAIAHVELKTKRAEDELGSMVLIAGSEVTDHKPIACQDGTSILVKNLFYNVPARRNFLKADHIEMNHIEEEFYRVALIHADRTFSLLHNDKLIVKSPESNFKKRIINLMGAHFTDKLYPIEHNTDFIKVSGFIAKPENAKKKKSEQYLFINNRYVRHHLLNYAIETAYKELIPADYKPAYFIQLQVDPATIDFNISPTKVEVKLQDERMVFGFLNATVKRSIGEFSRTPQLDFDREKGFDVTQYDTGKDVPITMPSMGVNPNYNPFHSSSKQGSGGSYSRTFDNYHKPDHAQNEGWSNLLQDIKEESINIPSAINFENSEELPLQTSEPIHAGKSNFDTLLIVQQRYILFVMQDILTIVDSSHAHERILYERYLEALQNTPVVIQQLLFPETITLTPGNAEILSELTAEFHALGYDIEAINSTQFAVNGTPHNEDPSVIQEVIELTIENYKSNRLLQRENRDHHIALSLSKLKKRYFKPIDTQEKAQSVIKQLFACQVSDIDPEGQKIIYIIGVEELRSFFGA